MVLVAASRQRNLAQGAVSVVGDVEQLGSKRASVARETYLPPGSTVIVSNLYWTSPATKSLK